MIGRMNRGEERKPMMNAKPNREQCSFRFRTGKDQWLTDQIACIEAVATERLRAGVSFHSVQTGALALLKMLLDGVSGELVEAADEPAGIQACAPAAEPPRCEAKER